MVDSSAATNGKDQSFHSWVKEVVEDHVPINYLPNFDLDVEPTQESDYAAIFETMLADPELDWAVIYDYVRLKRYCEVLEADLQSGRVSVFPAFEVDIRNSIKQHYYLNSGPTDNHFIISLREKYKKSYADYQKRFENNVKMVENRISEMAEKRQAKYSSLIAGVNAMGLENTEEMETKTAESADKTTSESSSSTESSSLGTCEGRSPDSMLSSPFSSTNTSYSEELGD
ncbi:unnamed protein product [Bursaphelenchus xylophilus]|uniref:(pine wood nematode) hypothetical protein n=1 Tax=Bursaphelenchus xylophilus TaxID=6326 RepID=A0A1I7S895_BURXY|nr:unnamed protein product [Bursaphelenchus xylophilus]CAG9080397.1 unnamed protein product [Bursaphelenchus xylophilus]